MLAETTTETLRVFKERYILKIDPQFLVFEDGSICKLFERVNCRRENVGEYSSLEKYLYKVVRFMDFHEVETPKERLSRNLEDLRNSLMFDGISFSL